MSLALERTKSNQSAQTHIGPPEFRDSSIAELLPTTKVAWEDSLIDQTSRPVLRQSDMDSSILGKDPALRKTFSMTFNDTTYDTLEDGRVSRFEFFKFKQLNYGTLFFSLAGILLCVIAVSSFLKKDSGKKLFY